MFRCFVMAPGYYAIPDWVDNRPELFWWYPFESLFEAKANLSLVVEISGPDDLTDENMEIIRRGCMLGEALIGKIPTREQIIQRLENAHTPVTTPLPLLYQIDLDGGQRRMLVQFNERFVGGMPDVARYHCDVAFSWLPVMDKHLLDGVWISGIYPEGIIFQIRASWLRLRHTGTPAFDDVPIPLSVWAVDKLTRHVKEAK